MHIRPNLILTFILSPRPLQGNVEIETYWLKGKRDKDGNAQAACPQFETHTISKVDISSPEAKGDKEAVVRDPPSVDGLHSNVLHCRRHHHHQLCNSQNSCPQGSSMAAGQNENDVKSLRSHRIKMEISGHNLEESMARCRVEEMSVHKVSGIYCCQRFRDFQ